MPDTTLQEVAARMLVYADPMNMQGQALIGEIARAAHESATNPMPEIKEITDADKLHGVVFMSKFAWHE